MFQFFFLGLSAGAAAFAAKPSGRRGDWRLVGLWFFRLPIAALPVLGHKRLPLRPIDRRGLRKIKGPATLGRRGATRRYAPRWTLGRHIAKPPVHPRSALMAMLDAEKPGLSGAAASHHSRGAAKRRPSKSHFGEEDLKHGTELLLCKAKSTGRLSTVCIWGHRRRYTRGAHESLAPIGWKRRLPCLATGRGGCSDPCATRAACTAETAGCRRKGRTSCRSSIFVS